MECYGERKIKVKEAKLLIMEYLGTISDILGIKIRKNEKNRVYEARYTQVNNGQIDNFLIKLSYLNFLDLLALALKSKGYNILSLEYKSKGKFQGFILQYCPIEKVSRNL